jgi:hypothetical protein
MTFNVFILFPLMFDGSPTLIVPINRWARAGLFLESGAAGLSGSTDLLVVARNQYKVPLTILYPFSSLH